MQNRPDLELYIFPKRPPQEHPDVIGPDEYNERETWHRFDKLMAEQKRFSDEELGLEFYTRFASLCTFRVSGRRAGKATLAKETNTMYRFMMEDHAIL